MPKHQPKALNGKAGQAFARMPPLAHKPTDQFDPDQSEIFDWMRTQPEIMQWLFDKARAAKKIEYDSFLEKWHGTKSANQS